METTGISERAPSLPATFDQWWDSAGDWVEPPNERRGGYSGVQRLQRDGHLLYCKRQSGHLYRSWRRPLGQPTIVREARVLTALQRLDIGVPKIVFVGARKIGGQWQALLVSQALDGFFSLRDWYAGQGEKWGAALQKQMLEAVGRTLGRLHVRGWQHGCLYPKHIFLHVHIAAGTPLLAVALLDLEKSRRRISSSAAARHDLRQLYRHRQGMPDAHWQLLMEGHRVGMGTRSRIEP